MALPDAADRILVGPLGAVEFAVKNGDQMADAWKWWNGADKSAKAMLKALMMRVVEKGDVQSETAFKQLDGPVWEFKRGSYRLLCYRDGDRCLLTNALMKSGRSDISQDIKKAKRIGERHLAWEASQSRASGP